MEMRIKKSYICKEVSSWEMPAKPMRSFRPAAGDVGIFEVLELGKHKSIQSDTRRNVSILPGDRIMAAFGTRYATAQFEGYVPDDCNQELHILGAGGTVGVVKSMHEKFSSIGPTKLKFLGPAVDKNGQVINTRSLQAHRLTEFSGGAAGSTRVILSIGSSMDSGKTTSAAFLCRGLKKAGYRVAFIKLTGTVYTKDCDLNYDLGADLAADFGEFGFPSTYMCSETELLDLYESLLVTASVAKPDYVVMEIADGIYQRETMMLLQNAEFMETIHAVIFSAGDSLAAINGIQVLEGLGIYPFAISGLLTASPLLIQETRTHCSLPVYTIEELTNRTSFILKSVREKTAFSRRKLKRAS